MVSGWKTDTPAVLASVLSHILFLGCRSQGKERYHGSIYGVPNNMTTLNLRIEFHCLIITIFTVK